MYVVLHIFVWGLFFCFPLLIIPAEELSLVSLVRKSWLALTFAMILFYLNHFFGVERFFLQKKYAAYIILNLLLIIFFLGLIEYIKSFIESNRPPEIRYRIEFSIYRNSITLVLSVVSAMALGILRQWLITERNKQQEENERLQSELAHLHYQLQPHFFFNSLNNIYSLIETKPDTARDLVHSLSGLMRYMLYEARETRVPLQREIAFLKLFIVQMSTRVHEKVQVNASFPDDVADKEIAPLLFIPLVENIFKHGINPSGHCEIDIHMKMEGNELYFHTRNEIFDFEVTREYRHGIGLNNLRRRLELLYPGKYEFVISVEADQYYITRLKIVL